MSVRNVYCRCCGALVDTQGLEHARKAYTRVINGKPLLTCPICVSNPANDCARLAAEKEMLEERQ